MQYYITVHFLETLEMTENDIQWNLSNKIVKSNTVKSRFYWVVGRHQKVYKIEIINKIEIFYLLLVSEGTQ